MQDILEDEKQTGKSRLNKKSIISFIAYIPVSWLLLLICSPIFVKIYTNELLNEWVKDAVMVTVSTPLIIIAWLIIRTLFVRHWKIYLLFAIESNFAVAGIFVIIALLMYHQQIF